MAQKTRADLLTDITTNFADNSTGDISAEDMRNMLTNLSDSMVNSTTDTGLVGLSEYSTTRVYYSGQIVQYDYKWYVANTTTVAGAFDSADWDFQGYVTYNTSLVIETGTVLALNTTPVTAIAAIASRTLRLKNVRARIDYNSIAYATNTTINIYMPVGGSPNSQFTIPTMLAATADQHRIGTVTAGAQVEENQPIKVTVNTGDPTAGNSQITIYFEYNVVE